MILDTSALVAILYGEPERVRFAQLIHEANTCSISVASFVELSMVVEGQIGADAARQVDTLFRRIGVTIEPVTIEQGLIARQAFVDFGKGRHKAGLNFGDCFSYALAKAKGEALLFKGRDFSETDIVSAA